MNSTKLIGIISLVILLAFNWSCGEKAQHDTIPHVRVHMQVDVNSTMYLELNTIGGWVYLTGGYSGILVYRLSLDEFMAYERACPHDPYKKDCRIVMDDSGITCSDPCCESQFNILDGTIISGPSTLPLKRYYTYFDGTYLTIND